MRETEKTQIGYVNPCKISSKNPPFFFSPRLKILVTHAYTHMHANAHAYTHARTCTHTHKHICPHHNSILPRLRPKRPTNGPSNNDGITNLNKFWLVQIFTTWSHMHEKKTNKNKSPGISCANWAGALTPISWREKSGNQWMDLPTDWPMGRRTLL